jgi:glutaredoxin
MFDKMFDIVIYKMAGCPHCIEASKYLDSLDVLYQEIYVNEKAERLALYSKWEREDELGLIPSNAMPQIFVDGERVGGNEQLQISGLREAIEAARINGEKPPFVSAAPLPSATLPAAPARTLAAARAAFPPDPARAGWHLWEFDRGAGTSRFEVPLYWQPNRAISGNGVWLLRTASAEPTMWTAEALGEEKVRYLGSLVLFPPMNLPGHLVTGATAP